MPKGLPSFARRCFRFGGVRGSTRQHLATRRLKGRLLFENKVLACPNVPRGKSGMLNAGSPALGPKLCSRRIVDNVDEVCSPLGHANSCGLPSGFQRTGGDFRAGANAIAKILNSVTMRFLLRPLLNS